MQLEAHPAIDINASHNEAPVEMAMLVTKRNGTKEQVDLNKIVKAISRCCGGLSYVDPMKIATSTISGLYDGATTSELDELSIRTSAMLIAEEPEYGRLAGRLLAEYIQKEVTNQDIQSFSQSVSLGADLGLANARLLEFTSRNSRKLNSAIKDERDQLFDYFGLRTVYDRYLLRHPKTRKVIETPQHFFMRIAAALGGGSMVETLALYDLMSKLDYLPSSPTLFNSGTVREQLSSCFLLDSPNDSLEGIYDRYADVAKLSKYAGGIGLSYSRVRSRGSHIKGTNGQSNGIIPWIKTLDSSVAAVNQGGKRKGAACVYLESWHADIEDFLELRDNTGDEQRRAHNLNLANWVPDLFMKRVEQDGDWTLFDPSVAPELVDLYGPSWEQRYIELVEEGKGSKTIKARSLYGKMMRTLAQTGQGWMTFKDRCNSTSNQTGAGSVIHLSNLCTEILEVTSQEETAVCNLGSINLGQHLKVVDGMTVIDYDRLRQTVTCAIRQLNRVIDLNYYTIPTARASNMRWRPIGLGVMGLQDALFQMGLSFDSAEALKVSNNFAEAIYFYSLQTSNSLAREEGPHDAFQETRAAKGDLQFRHWDVDYSEMLFSPEEWEKLRKSIMLNGLRNSLMIAIAPTATIASIVGCYECIEPQVSNLFKRETMSGDFIQVNKYLTNDLKALGLWTAEMRDAIKSSEGSVQGIESIPYELRLRYRTAWELPMKSLIDMAAGRNAYIDQSQSLNLFQENPNIGSLSSMYMYAWKKGLKTTYYLRSRPATRIQKSTVASSASVAPIDAVSCSLENPESCESCQ